VEFFIQFGAVNHNSEVHQLADGLDVNIFDKRFRVFINQNLFFLNKLDGKPSDSRVVFVNCRY